MEAPREREYRFGGTPPLSAMTGGKTGAIALLLTLLTGLVLGQFTVFVSRNAAPAAIPSDNNTERVRAFYEGMNRYIATGDDTVLDLLAPDFQDFSSLNPTPGTADTLLARLDALRQSQIPPHFIIEELHDLDTLVEVLVTTNLPSAFDVCGLSVTTNAGNSTLEFVQLQRNAIVARWSQDDALPSIDNSLDDTLPLESASALVFDIDKVTIAPGAELVLSGGAPFALLLDEGPLSLTTGSTQQVVSDHGQWVDSIAPSQLVNTGTEPSTLWLIPIGIVSTNPGLILGMVDQPVQPGVDIERFAWSAQKVPPAPTALHLRLVRVTLPPGTEFVAHKSLLGESLAVIDGTLSVSLEAGAAQHFHRDGSATPIEGSEPVSAGEGVAPSLDASISYRVTGATPATLLVFTAEPGPA